MIERYDSANPPQDSRINWFLVIMRTILRVFAMIIGFIHLL
ncbi:hypothetical protein ymoll0001_39600 [Yersinia mollaretii ATCC 43969]|uniref:Uncharacterized protein n=1 Tax=Yersinia mollaretii (strain ATCC 43969 / DSM 18520 / CIP 103324 / CNY 7263 / WAIP 204) TaxID=349967 RepID=A0ABM9Y4I9_YERMW|nr:hypothetical protein ymoll0001_39600 [Yersinia mollaretii ATCC 43969]